jgi:hypothetical protein
MIMVAVLWGTLLELGRVALAKLGHDPYGMLFRDRPWREAIPATYRGHRDCLRKRR